jgi:hypothetical protein
VRIKAVFIGDSGVGKSSLYIRLPTIGGSPAKISIPTRNVENRLLKKHAILYLESLFQYFKISSPQYTASLSPFASLINTNCSLIHLQENRESEKLTRILEMNEQFANYEFTTGVVRK